VARLPIAGKQLSWTLSAITASGRQPSRAVTALLDLMADAVRQDGPYF
jgi:hypothetical protein